MENDSIPGAWKVSMEKSGMSNFHSLNACLKNDCRVPSHSTHNIKWSEIFMVEEIILKQKTHNALWGDWCWIKEFTFVCNSNLN